MKKLFFAIIIVCNVLIARGQNQNDTIKSKNEIGVVLTDLVNGAFQVKYERLLGKHISVNVGLGIKGSDGLIRLSGLDTDQLKTNDITYSGFKIIPEVRYYLNKTQTYTMDGFYFGAYLKYTKLQSDLNGTYINDALESFIVEFDADIKVTSVGFMVGYKLPLTKKFSLDFLIAGPGAGFYNFSFVNKRDLPDEFYEDFNQALDKYSIFDLLSGDFEFKSTDKKSNFTVPSLRWGISLGYSF
jgi:hypothetical protein